MINSAGTVEFEMHLIPRGPFGCESKIVYKTTLEANVAILLKVPSSEGFDTVIDIFLSPPQIAHSTIVDCSKVRSELCGRKRSRPPARHMVTVTGRRSPSKTVAASPHSWRGRPRAI